MFKKSFTVVVAVVIVGLLSFNVASAQTTGSAVDLQVLVKQLQAQIQVLQAQISDLQVEVQSVKLELKFSRALAQGSTGDDVKQLQEFLKTFTGAYPDGLITGYYGPRTVGAVKKFQAQNGIESVGIVGPKTQEKINVLAAAIPAATPCINCSPTTTEPTPIPGAQTTPTVPSQGVGIPATPAIPALPTMLATPCRTPTGVHIQPNVITVLSPNGGEQWQVGGTYTIKYSAKNVLGNKALLIYLEKGYDAPSTKIGANSSQLIGVTTNLESYTYTLPNNIQSWPGLGSNYKITIMVEGSYSSCGAVSYDGDSSDAEFSIVVGQYNAPGTSVGGYGVSAIPMPVTPKFSGSTPVLTQIQDSSVSTQTTQNKINILLSQIAALQDQLNSTIDTATRDSLVVQIISLKAQVEALQTNSAAVSATQGITTSGGGYVQPVQDKPTATQVPETAVSTQTTATSQAIPTAQSPSITILSPNGGETLTIGKMYEIKWTGGNKSVDLYLLDNPTRFGKKIFSGIINNNYISWAASPLSSSDLSNYVTPSGQYIILVNCTDGNCAVDFSDSYFKIIEQ